MEKIIYIYTDGASRGNPGPGAIAFIITNENGDVLKESAKYIGNTTNNIAEYKALIFALNEAKGLGEKVVCFSDSKLMISQLKSEYKVKKSHIKELFNEVKSLEKNFKLVEYVNVRRENEMTKKVDKKVNEVLDAIEKQTKRR
ncbi:MAG: ribonuclease HI family protein [Candidatus Aenigmatarchaeota archaeon]